MVDTNAPPAYPTAEHVRAGPPDPAKDPERAKAEKWCRVLAIIPTKRETGHDFVIKGPLSIPMAVRRKGTNLGSRDAWIFFTHPYAVFHKDAAFWNAPVVPGKGVLEARLLERTPHGFRLFDEVGAGFEADRVPASFPAALGVFRDRQLKGGLTGTYALDVIRLELDVLEAFRLCTLCLKTRSPLNALAELDKLLKKHNVETFTKDIFDDADRNVIRQFGSLRSSGTFTEVTNRFWVNEAHFMQTADVKDGNGKQLILDLIKQWQRFEAEHGAKAEQLGRDIATCEAEARKIAMEIEREKDAGSEESRLTRFFSRRVKAIQHLESQQKGQLEKKKALEAEFDKIPGYEVVKGLSDRIEGFKKIVDGVRRLATNVFDQNVTQQQIKNLEDIYKKQLEPGAEESLKAGYKAYELKVRADVLPRILMAYSTSAYVLRRPDALVGELSLRNVRRINKMAAQLIEYFRDARFGDRTLGHVFDESWGQIVILEGRL